MMCSWARRASKVGLALAAAYPFAYVEIGLLESLRCECEERDPSELEAARGIAEIEAWLSWPDRPTG